MLIYGVSSLAATAALLLMISALARRAPSYSLHEVVDTLLFRIDVQYNPMVTAGKDYEE